MDDLLLTGPEFRSTSVIKGCALFTRSFFKILRWPPNENVFFCPMSLHVILSIVAQGAKGMTEEDLVDILNLPTHETTAREYKEIIERLMNIKDVTLHFANKVYFKESYELKKEFIDVTTNVFHCDLEQVNFKNWRKTVPSINSWVQEKTNNTIAHIVDDIDLNLYSQIFILNALYFKGLWAKPFDTDLTITEQFYVNQFDVIRVRMMRITDTFYFKEYECLGARILAMPYQNKNVNFVVILPYWRDGLDLVERRLDDFDLSRILSNMDLTELQVTIPRFKVECTLLLTDSVKRLGLGVLFDDEDSRLSGMLEKDEPIAITKIIQKGFLEVNENGVEAAASTDTEISDGSSLPVEREIKTFIVDCPFLFLLVEQENQKAEANILYMGRIVKPNLRESTI